MKKIACLISFLMVQGACFSAFSMDEESFSTSRPPSPRAAASVDQEERGHRFTQFKESLDALNKKISECVNYLKFQTAQMFLRINDPENQDPQKDRETESHGKLEDILEALKPLQKSIKTLLEMEVVHYQANSAALEQKLEEMRQTYFERILQVTEIQKGDILSTLAAQKDALSHYRRELEVQDQEMADLKQQLLKVTQEALETERRRAASAERVRPQQLAAAAENAEDSAAAAAGPLALVVQNSTFNAFQIFQEQKPVGHRFEFVGTCYLEPMSPFPMDLLLASHGNHRESLKNFFGKSSFSLASSARDALRYEIKLTEWILQILQKAKVASSSSTKVFKEEKEGRERECMEAIIDFYLAMFSQRFVFLNNLSMASSSNISSLRPTVFLSETPLKDDQGQQNRKIDEMIQTLSNLRDLLSDLDPRHLESTAPLALTDRWASLIGGFSTEEKGLSFAAIEKLNTLKANIEKKSHSSVPNISSVSDYIQSIIDKLSAKRTLDKGNLGKFFNLVK